MEKQDTRISDGKATPHIEEMKSEYATAAEEVNPLEGIENGNLSGVMKKMVTEWRRIDKIMVICSIFFINFVVAMDSSATATIQPTVLSEFNAMTRAGVIGTVTYLLTGGIGPFFAKISDVFGHMYALCTSMVLHTLGFVICGASKNFATVFAGTTISVLGQAGYSTIVNIIIADILPLHLRGSVTAYTSIPWVTNYYLGVEVGKGLENKWHWVYWILTILAIVCSTPAIFSLIRIDRHARKIIRESGLQPAKLPLMQVLKNTFFELDVIGLVLLSGGCISILAPLGMQLNTINGWGSYNVILPIAIGVVALATFVFYEWKFARYPVIPFRLLRIPTFTSAILATTFFYFTSNVTLFYFNAYIQVTRDVDSRTAMLLQLGSNGYYLGLIFGGWAMQWTKRYRRWAWVGWAIWLLAVGLMFRSRSGDGTNNAEVAIVQAILGIGSGIAIGCVNIGVQAAVTSADLSIAITLFTMIKYLGGVLGEGTSTTIWVNVLPTKIEGKLDPSVDVFSSINNITYYHELPKDQRMIIQHGYVSTQKILTICGICTMLVAGIFMLGLAPYELSTSNSGEGDKMGADIKQSSLDKKFKRVVCKLNPFARKRQSETTQ